MRIANVVFDAPCAGDMQLYGAKAGAVATMYAELLGLRRQSRAEALREAGYEAGPDDELDPLVRPVDPDGIGFAFEPQGEGYEPPRWPDPSYPQHIHLDVFVPDVGEAAKLVTGLGATRLRENIYADPVGHPFCLIEGDGPRIGRIVFDCPDPERLARFYADLTGIEIFAFQRAESPRPQWPDPRFPEQVHLDLAFDDAEAARDAAIELGATRLRATDYHHVLADPAGHPFCV